MATTTTAQLRSRAARPTGRATKPATMDAWSRMRVQTEIYNALRPGNQDRFVHWSNGSSMPSRMVVGFAAQPRVKYGARGDAFATGGNEHIIIFRDCVTGSTRRFDLTQDEYTEIRGIIAAYIGEA